MKRFIKKSLYKIFVSLFLIFYSLVPQTIAIGQVIEEYSQGSAAPIEEEEIPEESLLEEEVVLPEEELPPIVEEPLVEEPVIEEPVIEPEEVIKEVLSIPVWVINDSSATTYDVVKLGETYIAPQNSRVRVIFTKLPENPTKLTITEITLTQEEVEATNAVSNIAYDITTDMIDGTFEYDLTLPSSNENVNIVYAEEREDILNNTQEIEGDVVVEDGVAKVEGVDHFTIVIVTNPGPKLSTAMVNGKPYVSVPPSTNVTVELQVTTSGSENDDNWKSSQYLIEGGSWTCVNTGNHTGDGTYTDDFDLNAPALVGTYDLFLRAYNGDDCTGGVSIDYVMGNAITVATPAPALTPPTLTDDPSDPISLTSVGGVWTSISGGSGYQGVGTNEIRWGSPAGAQKSGLRFTNSGNQSFETGDTFYLGMLTHMNWPTIHGTAATGAKLQITLDFNRPDIDNAVLSYDFSIEETPNSEGDCPIYQRTLTACDDKVTFPNSYGTTVFTIGDIIYTLVIDGFVNAYPTGTAVDAFITEEQKDNSAFLVGHLSSVLVEKPAISVTKKTNDQDISSAPGQNLYIGDTVTWQYIVQNTGNVTLTNISVTDNPSVTITCPGTSLSAGATMECSASGTVSEGQFTNTATVTGTPPTGSNVSASDSSWYFGTPRFGHLIVQKTTTPSGDPTVFTTNLLNSTGTVVDTGTVTDSTDKDYEVTPGTYSVTENTLPGWGMTNNGCTGIQIDAGETEYCTIVNKKLPVLTVEKVLVGESIPYTNFSFIVDGGASFQFEADGSNNIYVVPGQTYTITESNPGSGYNVTYSSGCTGNLTYNQSATCTITNTRYGSLTIVKNANPDSSQDFSFSTSGTGLSVFSLDDDTDGTLSNTKTFTNLLPGTYSVTESTVSGWDLTNAVCSDGSSNTSINLSAGEDVTCTFTNTMRSAIGGHKYNDADGNILTTGDRTGVAGWTIELWQNEVKLDTTTTAGTNGTYGFSNLVPGTYKLRESLQVGWYTLSPSSFDDYITVELLPGENDFSNDFINVEFASVTILKNVDTDGDGDIDITNSNAWTWDVDGSGDYATGTIFSRFTPGTYIFSEEQKDGYHVTSLVCNNGTGGMDNSYGAVESQSISVSSGQNLVCTFTNTRDTGTLKVVKELTNDNGGTLNEGNFSFKVNEGSDITFDTDGINEITVPTGTYTIVENTVSGYSTTYDNCSGVVVANGGTQTCTITNDDIAPTLKLVKSVTNDNGGTIQANSWDLTAAGSLLGFTDKGDSTTFHTVKAGIEYTLSESTVPGYSAGSWSCSGGGTLVGNKIILGLDDDVACTITNNDIGPTVTLVKNVIKDDGGTAGVNEFGLTIGGTPVTSGQTLGVRANTNIVLTETGKAGYQFVSMTGTGCPANLGGTVNLQPGQNITCTITNDDIQPKLTVTKIVDGGSAQVSDFPLYVDSTQVTSGQQNGFSVGRRIVHEALGSRPYTPTFSGDCDALGYVTLNLGDVKNCTITNTRDTATLRVLKNVDLNGDGDYTDPSETNATNWQWSTSWLDIPEFDHSGNTGDPAITVNTGLYQLAEVQKSGFHKVSLDCSNAFVSENTVTVAKGQNVVCTFTNARDTGTIELKKVWSGTPGQTNLNIGTTVGGSEIVTVQTGASGGTPLTTGQQTVPTGTYYLSESGGLDSYTKSPLSCFNDTDNDGSKDENESIVSVDSNDSVSVATGNHIVCSYTNTRQQGTIIVKKVMVGGTDTFTFTGTPSGTISTNEGILSGTVDTGSYTTIESDLTGWKLTDISCSDGNSTSPSIGDLANKKATFNVEPGETVECVFTNEKFGSVTAYKYHDFNQDDNQDAGEPGLSGWNMTLYTGSNCQDGNSMGTESTDINGNATFSSIIPGQEYSIKESQKDGWENVSDMCQNFTVTAGEAKRINFGNIQKPITIKAHKIVCTDESQLPNWGAGGPNITATTAQDWVNSHNSCTFVRDWNFQWGNEGSSSSMNPGDNTGETSDIRWHKFGPTVDGLATVEINANQFSGFNSLWMREVWNSNYIPFTYNIEGNNSNHVTAEIYCHTDVLNYDNLDRIDNIKAGETYYCVAWNVESKEDLSVTKTVNWAGITPDSSRTFEICISGPSYPNGDCKTSDYDGQVLTWTDLLVGQYTVTETDPGSHWSVTGSGDTITVGHEISATHTVVNTYKPYCGDGVINQESERCDGKDGVSANGSNFCTSQCKLIPIYNGANSCAPGTTPVKVGDTHILGSQDSDGVNISLSANQEYLFKVSGAYQFGSNANRQADAAYGTENNWNSTRDDLGIWGTSYKGVLSVLANLGAGVGVVIWDNDSVYNSPHVYQKAFTPSDDMSAQFLISDWYDEWYGDSCDNQGCMNDNSGSLELEVYECQAFGSIQGRKYYDVNINGDFDQFEKEQLGDPNRLNGWTIELWNKDLSVKVAEAVTGVDAPDNNVDKGQYRFIDVVPGTYNICEESREGWYQTEPSTGIQYNNLFCHTVTVDPGQAVDTIQFGNYQGSDVNICKKDNYNRGLEDWDVVLASEQVQSATSINVSNVSGTNSSSLPAGTYLIKVSGTYRYGNSQMIADAGYSFRPIGIPSGTGGWVSGLDLPSNGLMALVNGNPVNWGAYNDAHQYTYVYEHTGGSVNISIYDDYYGDNVNNNNFVFEVYEVNDWAEGTTGENGCVVLDAVPYGEYILDEFLKDGWVDMSGKGDVVIVNDLTEDFTIKNRIDAPVTIVATKIVCEYEEDLPNWGAVKSDGNPITQNSIDQFLTDTEGRCRVVPDWEFEWGYQGANNPGDDLVGYGGDNWNTFTSSVQINQLQGGRLELREVLKENYIPFTYASNGDNSDNFSAEFYCHNDVMNYDNWEWLNTPEYGQTYYCVGFNTLERYDIHGYKWHDLDRDGERSCIAEEESVSFIDKLVNPLEFGIDRQVQQICELEPLLSGWKIFIDEDEDGEWDETEIFDITDEEDHLGWYLFEDLVPGEYTICEEPQEGWVQTYPLNEENNCHVLTLPDDNPNRYPEQLNAVDGPVYRFGNIHKGSVTVYKFHDLNANGTHDEGEPYLSDWEITMSKVEAENTNQNTGVDGSTVFSLLPDSYVLSETLQDGWDQTGIYCEDQGEGVLITAPGEAYGHHGACSGWNGCGDAQTCAQWACEVNGYSNLVSYGAQKTCPEFGDCNLFNSRGSIDMSWDNRSDCPVMGVTDIYCSNGNGLPSSISAYISEDGGYHDNVYDLTVNPGDEKRCFVGNVENSELYISETNDSWPNILGIGDTFKYTITVRAEKGPLTNVVLVNLPPKGIIPQLGTFSALSSERGILDTSGVVYASPGTWNLGNLKKDETVTITYIAKVTDEIDSGIYPDLSYAYGTGVAGSSIFALSEGSGFEISDGIVTKNYVGTQIQIGEEPEIEEGEVLGAAITLPRTGADTYITLGALISMILGLVLVVFNPKKKIKNLIVTGVLLLGVFSFVKPVPTYAVESEDIDVRIEQPQTPTNKDTFKIGFVALDLQNRPISVQCYVNGVTLGTPYLMNSGDCVADSTVITASGTYEFYVKATADADVKTSSSVFVEVKLEKPLPVVNYSKAEGTCKYTLTFKTADDGRTSKVEIFRSSEQPFTANASTLINTLTVAPNTDLSYTDTGITDCNKEYYYAIRALDDLGNFSSFVTDNIVTLVTTPGTTETEVAVNGETGEVAGKETTTEDSQKPTEEVVDNGEVKGDEDVDSEKGEEEDNSVKSIWSEYKYFIIAVLVVALGSGIYTYVKRKR